MKIPAFLLVLGLASLASAHGCAGTSDAQRALVCKEVSDTRGVVKAGLSPDDAKLVDLVFDFVVADVNSAILGSPLRSDVGALALGLDASGKLVLGPKK